MSRLPPILPSQMDAAQRRVVEAATVGRRRYPPAPLAAWLRSPAMALQAQTFGESIRFDLHLAPAVVAVAALTAATHWAAAYVQGVQSGKLRTEGVQASDIAAIKAGVLPALNDPAQATAHRVTLCLLQGRGLDNAAYADAVAVLGERGMVELVAAIGYYSFVSMTDAAFGIAAPDPSA